MLYMASDHDRYLLCFKTSRTPFIQLPSQTVCCVFVKELVRSAFNQAGCLRAGGISSHDYAGALFTHWEKHDGLVLFKAL